MDTEAWRRESEEPERNRETRRGQEEPEEDGGRAESAKTEKRLCFKSKYLLLNNTFFLFFALLLPSSSSSLPPGLAPPSGDSCFASPLRASAPRPGLEPQSSTRKAVTLPLSHWDFHTNIAFFCALVFFNS